LPKENEVLHHTSGENLARIAPKLLKHGISRGNAIEVALNTISRQQRRPPHRTTLKQIHALKIRRPLVNIAEQIYLKH
jgi:hypothetical protein